MLAPHSPESLPYAAEHRMLTQRHTYKDVLEAGFGYWLNKLSQFLPSFETEEELSQALSDYCKANNKKWVSARVDLRPNSKMICKRNGFKIFLDENGDVAVQHLAKLGSEDNWTYLDAELLH